MDNNLKQQIGAEERRREAASRRKKTKKIIQIPRPILFLIIIGVFAGLYIASNLLYFLGTETAMTSKQANLGAVNFSTSATEESSPNRIIVDVNERNTDGAYELGYEFKDEDENVLDEIQALEKIKQDLLKENGDLDLSKFSNSELNIIGALMYNGLKIEQYNEEELKALVIFLKADIAGQSFDLRPKDQIGQAVTLNDLRENDNVYGTLQVQRVKIEEANGVLGYKEELLEYIPYGDETTPNTFSYMVKNNDASVLNNFTINENGELLYAKSSTTNITYSYSLNGEPLSIENAQAIIPEENLGEEIHETNITASTPIDYKSRIKTYTASYGLLSDLLETTKNVDFCLELARVALNSKIVININEETTKTHQIQTQIYDQTTLLYDYVTYEISGTDSNTTTKTTELDRGNERPSESQSQELRKSGWNSSMTPTSSQGSSQGAILTYNWTHNGNNYTLVHTSNRYGNTWVLTREDKITTESSLPTDKADNELINIHNLTEPSLENEPYTAKEEITYTIKVETEETYNSCKIEIGKVDCWSVKYEKKYNTPVSEPVTIPENYETTGEFSEKSEGIEVPKLEIENDPHVQEFRNNRIQKYKSEHGADNVTIDFSGLTIKQRVKTNVSVKFDAIGPNIIYKFGEEDVDTTEVNWKNVIYINNKKEYTSYIEENGVEVPEIGFLYIYNKYITAGVDLYLQNDSEEKLFELLETDPQTGERGQPTEESIAIKQLLFIYDGIDRGITDFDMSIFEPNEFSSVKGLSGNTIADKIWYTLRSLGYSKASVAGVLGNLHYESMGLKPNIVELDTGIGIGLAQWSYGRRDALEAYARSKGVPWSDEDTQIEFLIDEIDGKSKYTNGLVKSDAFLSVKYKGVEYNKNVWKNAEEDNSETAIETATIAFCVSWERPLKPSDSLSTRIQHAKEYYEYYKDKEFGGTYTTEGCSGHVRAKFMSSSGRTFSILQQTKTFLSGQCNRAACICIASAYADTNISVNELVNDFTVKYDRAFHGAIPSNSAYWNKYGLEITNAYAGENTCDYEEALEQQLNSGGYALLWLNDGGKPYKGVSGTRWSSEYHWIAILGIKYEDGECFIAASTSGSGKNDWIKINEFTNHGVSHMVFISPIE